jgi:hypothetical protein
MFRSSWNTSASAKGGGYMIDFFGLGFDAAEKLGLLPDLGRIHYPVARLVFLDQSGKDRFSLPYMMPSKRFFDDRHFNFIAEISSVFSSRGFNTSV